MSNPSLIRCRDAAIQAAHRAGRLLAARRGRPKTVRTKRSDIDLVTEIDRASERLIYEALRRRFPGVGFQGEERIRTNPEAPFRWCVDPVDGTTNFVHGVPVFAISIALLHQDRPVVGVVYDPVQRETFAAVRGRGAWLNGRRMHVSRIRRMRRGLLSTGFSENFRHHPAPYLRWFQAFQSRCHAVRRMGCTSLSLAYVACGRQDGFYEQDLWPWDIAAGIVLVEEASGRVTDFRGRPVCLEDGRVVASNRLIHAEMLACLSVSAPAPSQR
ncbi:MAG: inositol monophosphatase [Candidatus Omnitrophica bacterium]|nr:inositol monophosphatase [Candidatus Omnitrophota bacterium]